MQKLIIAGNQANDIVTILRDNRIDFIRYDDAVEALKAAPDSAALMVLADINSEQPAPLPADFLKQTVQNN